MRKRTKRESKLPALGKKPPKNGKQRRKKTQTQPAKRNVHDKTEWIYFRDVLHKPQTDPWLRNSKQKIPHMLANRKPSYSALVLPHAYLKASPFQNRSEARVPVPPFFSV